MRNTGGNGGNGGNGDGEGDAMTSNTAPSQAQIELESHLEIYRDMLKEEKDTQRRNSLKYAIANLAAKL